MPQVAAEDNVGVSSEDSFSNIENDTEDLGKEEQKIRFVQLRAKGLSHAKIAKELKCLKGWTKKQGQRKVTTFLSQEFIFFLLISVNTDDQQKQTCNNCNNKN